MKKFAPLLLLAVLCLFLSGCATCAKIKQTRQNLEKLNAGMSIVQVFEIMGQPQSKKTSILENGKSLEVLQYRTDPDLYMPAFNLGLTPVCLEDGKVIGWGREFYRDKKRKERFLHP